MNFLDTAANSCTILMFWLNWNWFYTFFLFFCAAARYIFQISDTFLFFISLSPQALGSMYFIHKTLKNIHQYDFNGKNFTPYAWRLHWSWSFYCLSAGDGFILLFSLKKWDNFILTLTTPLASCTVLVMAHKWLIRAMLHMIGKSRVIF